MTEEFYIFNFLIAVLSILSLFKFRFAHYNTYVFILTRVAIMKKNRRRDYKKREEIP